MFYVSFSPFSYLPVERACCENDEKREDPICSHQRLSEFIQLNHGTKRYNRRWKFSRHNGIRETFNLQQIIELIPLWLVTLAATLKIKKNQDLANAARMMFEQTLFAERRIVTATVCCIDTGCEVGEVITILNPSVIMSNLGNSKAITKADFKHLSNNLSQIITWRWCSLADHVGMTEYMFEVLIW